MTLPRDLAGGCGHRAAAREVVALRARQVKIEIVRECPAAVRYAKDRSRRTASASAARASLDGNWGTSAPRTKVAPALRNELAGV